MRKRQADTIWKHDSEGRRRPRLCAHAAAGIAALTLLAFAASAFPARAAELNAALPHDSLAFMELDPGAAKNTGDNALLGVGLEAMQSFGVLPKEAALAGDVLGLASVAGNHHSCIALLDADLGVTGKNQLQCRSVQVAWVIETGGGAKEARAMVERLTQLLDHVSTPATARQSVRKTAEAKREYVEFHDAKWPAWMVLAWMQDGDRFVLTLGDGAMDHYLGGRPAGDAPWLETLTAADAQAARLGSSGNVMARLYVAVKPFRERFPDAMKKTVLGRMFDSLGFGDAAGSGGGIDSGLLSARGAGRVISLDGATFSGDKMVVTPWTVPLPADSPLLKLIPAEATAYLALKVDWQVTYGRALSLLDAMMPGASDVPVEKKVADFASRYGFDVRKDILSHLQPIVVVHDALRLPLMVTAVGAAAPAEAEHVQKSLTTLLNAAAETLDKKARKGASDLTRLRLRSDKDGVTYLQFGLVGPAWTWVDNRVVFSWSPAAVRYNVGVAGRVGAGAFGGGTAEP